MTVTEQPRTSAGFLEVTKPTDRDIVMTRVLEAPRELVFDAFTKPELLRRWYGPRGWSMTSCEIDLKPNGKWRYVLRRPDGTDFGMGGVYREIVRASRIVHSESYDVGSWGELVSTMVLLEHAGTTTLTSTLRHPSKEIRDANWGAEHGAAESYERLAELLATMVHRP